jgi:hypothetical protein
MEGSGLVPLVPFMLVWNEAINIQFLLYGFLLLYQLYQGYATAKAKNIKQHQLHMQAAAMFLLGPLGQRFFYNHLSARRHEHANFWQAATYSALMVLIDQSAARFAVRATLAAAFVAAVAFVYREESALQYLLLLISVTRIRDTRGVCAAQCPMRRGLQPRHPNAQGPLAPPPQCAISNHHLPNAQNFLRLRRALCAGAKGEQPSAPACPQTRAPVCRAWTALCAKPQCAKP